MSAPYPSERDTVGVTTVDERARRESVGELVGDIARDLSELMRQEVELAKTEVRGEARRAGSAFGMLGSAGLAGYLVLLFGSLAVMFGLDAVLPRAVAALIVAAIWAVVAAVLYRTGRTSLQRVNAKPEQTIQTLKEDAQWARHPTS